MKKYKAWDFPGVGMRMVKTAVAVLLSLVVSTLRPQGIPTYSAIAALLCLQASDATGLQTGVNRIVGTFIGAAWGLLGLLLAGYVPLFMDPLGRTVLAGVMVLPVIYTTVALRQTEATAITCVVFLSVLYSTGESAPLVFALNRTADTLIGVIIAYVVNGSWLRFVRNTTTLFVAGYDGVLAGGNSHLSQYTTVNLKRLLERGAAITLATHRTPATLMPRIADIPFELPLVIMNGAAVYNVKDRSFPFYVDIPVPVALALAKAADSELAQCHIYTIEHGELHVYSGAPRNAYEEVMHGSLRARQHQSLVQGAPPQGATILCLFIAGESEHIARVEETLRAHPDSREVTIIHNESPYREGHANIEVCSRHTGKNTAVRWLMAQEGYTRLVAYGCGEEDVALLKNADEAYLVDPADPEAEALPLPHLGSNEHDVVVRSIWRLFHRRAKGKAASKSAGRDV